MLATLLHEVLRHDHDQVALLERLSQGNPMNVAELGELVSRITIIGHEIVRRNTPDPDL